MKMSWIYRHNKKVFQRKVREYVGRKLSDDRRGYYCHACDSGGTWWGDEYINGLAVIFGRGNISVKIDIGRIPEYNEFQNETVASAGEAIIARVLYRTQKWSERPDDVIVIDKDAYNFDWLHTYILDREWGVEDDS